MGDEELQIENDSYEALPGMAESTRKPNDVKEFAFTCGTKENRVKKEKHKKCTIKQGRVKSSSGTGPC